MTVLVAVASSTLCLIAVIDRSAAEVAPLVLTFVSYLMLVMKLAPPKLFSRTVWGRFFYLVQLVSLVYFASVNQTYTDHFELVVYAGCVPLLLAMYTATPLRVWEVVASQVAVIVAVWRSSGSWSTITLEIALTVSVALGWYRNSMPFRKVRVFELFVHDMRGFLSSIRWTLAAPSADLIASASVEIERRLATISQLDLVLTTPKGLRRTTRFDAAQQLASVLQVELSSPLVIRANEESFRSALYLLGFASANGRSIEVYDAGRKVLLAITTDGPDWVIDNAVGAAARLLELPHRLEIGERIHLSLHRAHRGV